MAHRPARPLLALLIGATVLLGLAGCGDAGSGARPNDEATLLLDITPSAVHAGIFLARSRGFDEAEGVRLEIEPPSDAADAVELLSASRVDMAILDIHDLALARERGADLVAVMPLVQRPLVSVVAAKHITRPRELEGERVGVSGRPSDGAVLRSIVEGDGGDPDKVRTTTIGFTAVPALLSGRVTAATAFWNAEGVALRQERPGTRVFKPDDFGAPAYPELVLCVSRITLQDRRPLVRAVIKAIGRGYDETIIDPESAVTALVEEQHGLERTAVQRELEAVAPALVAGAGGFGVFSEKHVRAWAAWEAEVGITKEPVDIGLAFALR